MASRRIQVAVACLVMLAACDQERLMPVAPPVSPGDLQRFTTGDAARALNPDGRFSLGAPENPRAGQIVRADRAGDLALAYVRTFGRFIKEPLEKDRGAAIDLDRLRVDPRIVFARSPYGPFPDGFHPAIRRVFGPYYLVTLVAGSEPVLVIAVSAHTTDVGIDAKGELRLPWRSGNEFLPAAVAASENAGWGYRTNLPEQAVAHVGRLTGARTMRTPELVHMRRGTHPAYALWRLELDREVTVRGKDGARRGGTRAIFVGPGEMLYTAAARQPGLEEFEAPVLTGPAEAPRLGRVSLPVTHPTAYEEVTIDEPAR